MKTLKELLNKDEIGELFRKWKREEFGKTAEGFVSIRIDGVE